MHAFFLILFKRHCCEIWGMDSKLQDRDGAGTDPIQPLLLLSMEVQKAYIALRSEPLGILADFSSHTLKLLVKFLGKRVKGTTKSVFIGILSDYVSTSLRQMFNMRTCSHYNSVLLLAGSMPTIN